MEITNFEDRIPTHPGRKKLTIVSQTADTMIVDETLADAPTQEGTKINANVMTKLQQGIIDAIAKSDNAVTTANDATQTASFADTKSDSALSTALTALNNSEQAVSDSSYAKEKVLEVEGKLADRGATIQVGASTVTTITFTSDPQTQIDGKISNSFDEIRASVLTLAYPVGSIYLSVNSTSPASLFGGTWEQIEGKFLLGCNTSYLAGTTGGESMHTLTSSEMPSHNHQYSVSSTTSGSTALTVAQMPSHTHSVITLDSGYSANCTNFSTGYARAFGGLENSGNIVSVTKTANGNTQLINNTGSGSSHNHSITLSDTTTGNSGTNNAHNNMPPYLAVYMWKRIS